MSTKPSIIGILSPLIEDDKNPVIKKRKVKKLERSKDDVLATLLKTRMAVSELTAQYRREVDNWPENLPNYYLERAEELTALYRTLLDWEVDISRLSQ